MQATAWKDSAEQGPRAKPLVLAGPTVPQATELAQRAGQPANLCRVAARAAAVSAAALAMVSVAVKAVVRAVSAPWRARQSPWRTPATARELAAASRRRRSRCPPTRPGASPASAPLAACWSGCSGDRTSRRALPGQDLHEVAAWMTVKQSQ